MVLNKIGEYGKLKKPEGEVPALGEGEEVVVVALAAPPGELQAVP